MEVEASTTEDYRNMVTLLKHTLNIQFHSYDLNCEKPLKVVLRGIIQELTDKEITEDLGQQSYPVKKVPRMLGRDKKPSPLVLIEIGRKYKSIYNITACCGLSITVEPLKTKTSVTQCHRCQLYGGVRKNYNANYKCL